jgi:lysine 2,3-aminomutase
MINSPVEFWPESVEAIHKIQDVGARIYLQHPLLKGVNDDLETLVSLYDLVRTHNIEPHYLFHCVPITGQSHHRTTVQKGNELICKLTSSGKFSGRSKPKYTLMTDIGKITMWEGTILDRNQANNMILLQSGYKLEERLRYNPSYKVPKNAEVDEEGYMRVWYLDGEDDCFWDNSQK